MLLPPRSHAIFMLIVEKSTPVEEGEGGGSAAGVAAGALAGRCVLQLLRALGPRARSPRRETCCAALSGST